ncbi:hypothetical protein HWV62_5909 [Athelia sp. TMB]|nr:hypothetical protein HWV62_5909 [Athelia sp. TMB]
MKRSGQAFPGGVRLTIDTGDTDSPEPSSPFAIDFTTPTEHKFPPSSPSHLFPNVPLPTASKALNESRKLLAHLLVQLQNRTLPPPVFDAFKDVSGLPNETRLADVVKSVRAAVRLNGGRADMRAQPSLSQRDDSDEDDDSEQGFTTDATFSLMSQLKDVLLISRAQNWQIFHDSPPSGGIEDRRDSARSPFRLRRSSLQPGSNKRSRSGSPNPGSHVRAPALLSQCISVLASVVLEDCRYKISSPRPSRPPNALQAVVLDVAQFLIHTQHHDSKVISQIAFAIIPAFSTFHIELQPRLLAFFEEGIIRGVIQGLNLTQGASPIEPSLPSKEGPPVEGMEKAPISIQIEGPEDDTPEQTSRMAPQWKPWSSSLRAEHSAVVQSTRASHRPLPVYYLASIVPPLLVAMLESIDLNSPSPATLHRFCRLVELIATTKPDAYLDVLEVIAYHTTKARRSALCLLATFWPNAQFVHSTCLSRASSTDLPRCRSTKIDSGHMTITSDLLRLSFLDHYRDIITVKDLETRPYEDISVISSVLWTQLQLLNNGIALGSFVIQDSGPTGVASKKELQKWELHYVLEHCETYLASGRLPVSPAMDEYLLESHTTAAEHSMWFDWSNLVYIATLVKSSFEESQPVSVAQDLLNVHSIKGPMDEVEDSPRRYYELVPISHMRDALGFELRLYSDLTAGHLLAHLHHLGFFHRQDLSPILYEEKFTDDYIRCTFPIPLGLDLSTDVETLFAAVEGCLADLDLSVNEQGFLLLDTNLAAILRDYLAQNRPLPGVRGGVESAAWPSSHTGRPGPSSAISNGGDYVASRRALLTQYVSRWLLAFHDQDSDTYAKVFFAICAELAEDAFIEEESFIGKRDKETEKKRKSTYANSILRHIFDDLFLMWLENISSMDLYREPMPYLLRLFNRENIESSSRFSSMVDASFGPADAVGTAVADSWRMIMQVASSGKEGWSRSLKWLCLFARSGVDIPVATYRMFSSLASQHSATMEESALIVEAIFTSTWLKSLGRQELQSILSGLHARLCSEILQCITSVVQFDVADTLITLDIVTEDEVKDLPSRKKINSRTGPSSSDPTIVDAEFIKTIGAYVRSNMEDVSCLVAKFFNALVMDARYLEPYEIDNFVLRNGQTISFCAWEFYEIQRPEISAIRMTFLLRVLVVDVQPFQILLGEVFGPKGNWQGRALWMDEKLHPHFPRWKVISWDAIIEALLEDDYLQKHGENDDGASTAHLSYYGLSANEEEVDSSSDPEMITLRVSILLLSLKMIASGGNIDIFSILKIKFHLAQVLGFSDVTIVPASNGHAFHVRLGQFGDLPESGLPCITYLPAVFDAAHPFELAPTAMGGNYSDDETTFSMLVGSIFVDVLLHTFVEMPELATLPVLAVKSMLESLMIILYKHDLDVKPLKHLYVVLVKAVRRALELVQDELCYEIRQLALSVVQAFIKKWPTLRGGFIADAVEVVIKLIVSLDHDGEDILVGQAKSFLESTFTAFSANGLFALLCKRALDRDFFLVVKNITAKSKRQSLDSLRDALLRDAIQNVSENEPKVCEVMLGNIHHYIELVHHENYAADVIQGSGTHGQTNTVAPVIFEVLRDGLRKEGRITAATVASTMEVIMASDTPGYISPAQMFPDSFLSLAEDGFIFLQAHAWSEVQTENDFNASVAVAKAILRGAEQKPDVMSHTSDERNSRHMLSIRAWNMLAFAALSNPSPTWASILLAHFSTFSLAYNSTLRVFGNPVNNPAETAQADINHAYNAIKLWLLLALKKFRLRGVSLGRERDPVVLDDNEDAATRMIWNELWPAFSLIVTFFESENSVKEAAVSKMRALAALTWSSVADLFLFVRQSRSDVAREASSHVALLTRLHRLSTGDAATSNRLARALRTMAEPPLDVQTDTLITQIGKSMVAEEKILALDARSKESTAGRATQERTRRDIRVTT